MEKNSFILYKDQQEIIDKLSDENAGKLIKAIYKYANTGEIPELNELLSIAIIPFKQSIDRNSEKWEETKEKRRKAGKISAEKKKQVSTNQTHVESVEQKVTNSTHVESVEQTSTNSTVNVNVSDNVSVSVNNKEKNILKKEKHKYGKFGRVKLTDVEYDRLVSEYGQNFIDNQIESLDEYVESNNNKNKYTNFNLVLRRSIREKWFERKQTVKEPQWFNKENKSEEVSVEEQLELEKMLGDMTK